MKFIWAAPVVLLLTSVGFAQIPITQKDACKRFMPAVVRIDLADSAASGFIVSPDGWIITAGHVVLDQTGHLASAVAVRLPNGKTSLARVFIDRESAVRDFAILKVEATELPFLKLGSWGEIDPGSDVTIIGFPLSAGVEPTITITTKFCLSGFVTATDTVSKNQVKVDAIYFQGPAVKGLSGGPVISRDTGRVVGVQSQKLAGINEELAAIRNQLLAAKAQGVGIRLGTDYGETFLQLIGVIDRHLANGLGTATSADDVAGFLAVTKRNYERQHH